MEKLAEGFKVDSLNVLYVSATDKNVYNIRNTRYSFTVNKVIEGDISLEGKEINAEIQDQTLFQELDDSGMERARAVYKSNGYSEEEYSWLYSNREYCCSVTSVLKTGDNYIIFVGEIKYSNEKEPMYLLLNDIMFPEADVSDDMLLEYENVPIYSNYANNYTFFLPKGRFGLVYFIEK